jgi:hypothetical protein
MNTLAIFFIIYDFSQTYLCNMNITLSFGPLNEQIMKLEIWRQQEVKIQEPRRKTLKIKEP